MIRHSHYKILRECHGISQSGFHVITDEKRIKRRLGFSQSSLLSPSRVKAFWRSHCTRVSSACVHGKFVFINHPQYSLIHERTSTDPARAIASALKLLAARCYFLNFLRVSRDRIHYAGFTMLNLLITCHDDQPLMRNRFLIGKKRSIRESNKCSPVDINGLHLTGHRCM